MILVLRNDLIKAAIGSSGGNTPKGPKSSSGFGKDVDYIPKAKYPNRPKNAVGETERSWVIPKGGGLSTPKKDAPGNVPAAGQGLNNPKTQVPKQSASPSKYLKPTADEHRKLAQLAAEQGNTKLSEKHSKLAETAGPSNAEMAATPRDIKLPKSEGDKAQNLIHNSKASETKKRAKEVLNATSSINKPALKQIIEALENHETIPHIPSNDEKKELRELVQAVNNIAKPIEAKRAENKKLQEVKTKEKEKADQDRIKAREKQEKETGRKNEKARAAEEKAKQKFVVKQEKEKEQEKKKAERQKELDAKESAKVAKKKEEAYNKLKATLDRDIQKPKNADEEAQLATHTAEAKELLSKIDQALSENSDNLELVKLLEAHRRVAANQANMTRLPKKEDIQSLKGTKNIVGKQEKEKKKVQKEEEKAQKESEKMQQKRATQQQQPQQQPSSKPMNSYNTGRRVGEQVAHQVTQDDAGAQVSGQAVGGVGRGVASSSHHLLSDGKENKPKKDEEVEQSSLTKKSLILLNLNKAVGFDSDIDRNTDTFDDEHPSGLTSDLEDSTFEEADNAVKALLPDFDSLKSKFLLENGYSIKDINLNKSLKGRKSVLYSNWICDKIQSSVDSLRKGL